MYLGLCVLQYIQDPSQYVRNQMEALEAEQNHIDNRAGVVERKLRQLLETGTVIIPRNKADQWNQLLNTGEEHKYEE